MVVRMNGLVVTSRALQFAQGQIGHHFIGIHVGGCARTTLHHVDDETAVAFTCDDTVTGARDGSADALIQNPQIHIGQCAGFLGHGEGLHQFGKVLQHYAGDREVFSRPRRVHAIVGAFGRVTLPMESVSMRVRAIGYSAACM